MSPISAVLERRDALQAQLDAILAKPSAENRNALTDLENQQFESIAAEIRSLDVRVDEIRDLSKRKDDAAEARRLSGVGRSTTGLSVHEPDMYLPGGQNGNSYFRDLGRAKIFGDSEAADRLRRNAVYTESRALGNTGATGGSGGEFAPPQWVVDEFIAVIRAGRVTANLFQREQVPAGVSSINYPKVLTGTTTALQTTQNSSLSQTDMTTGFVQTGFATIGGKQVVSQQLIDQSAIDFDRLMMSDLGADLGLRVGTQIFAGSGNGTGTGAVVNGLTNATAGSTQTWTQANPTPAGFYGQCGALLTQFLGKRLLPPTCWVMSPRRWYWLESATDPNGRPLVPPNGPAFNPLATESNGPVAMGTVGTFHGLPVVIDPLVPTNLGSNSNQDIVYLLKTNDLVLFESTPAMEVFRDTYADTVSVLYRCYEYIGTILNRHPESIGVLTGTGLTPPPFAS